MATDILAGATLANLSIDMNAPHLHASVGSSLIAKTLTSSGPSSVMGTGIFALTTMHFSHRLPELAGMAWTLHWFNLGLFVQISIVWMISKVLGWPAGSSKFKHQGAANFYPTYGIALLVVAEQLVTFGGDTTTALVLWWLGVTLLFNLTVALLFAVFRREQITPSFFMSALGLLAIPMSGGLLLAVQPEGLRNLALIINGFGLGAGTFIYMTLLARGFHRFYTDKKSPPTITAIVWHILASLGVMVVSVMNLVAATSIADGKSNYLLAVFLLWGISAFWLVLAMLFSWSVREAAFLPFSLTWWSFTFPLGAFTLASQRLSEVSELTTPLAFGWLAWIVLAGIWTLTLVKTIISATTGKLFQPHS
ncbi:MAG: hypothetical protein Q8S20_22245 [Sulfuritalea sp.]|nr:hypothetical protein [Sulfuritalea sp.]